MLLALTGAAAQSKTALWLCACAQCCVDFFLEISDSAAWWEFSRQPTIIYIYIHMNWFILAHFVPELKHKSAGHPHVQWENQGFPIGFPFNRSVDFEDGNVEVPFLDLSFQWWGVLPILKLQYSSSNLLVLGREWMGCWGLLGWLLLVIMDHSRKFPAFSTSKPKRVNTCENYYWCCLKIGKPASPESIGYSSSILLKLGSRWQPSPFGTTLWTRPAALCATVPWPSCWKVRWTVGVMEDISIGL